MKNSYLGWILGILIGIFGIGASSFTYIYIVVKTGYMIGWIAIICGLISGGSFGLGYLLGNGKIKNKKESYIFTIITIMIGVMNMAIIYIGPYIYFFNSLISISEYFELLELSIYDILFILLGIYGSKLGGDFWKNRIIFKTLFTKEKINKI